MRRRLGLSVFVLAALALLAAAAGNAQPRASARDQALLRAVLAGMQTDLASVQIRALPAEWRSRARRGKKLLHVTSNATTPAGQVLDDWYGALIATAYNARCGRKADHCLAVYEVTGSGGGAVGGRLPKRPFAGRRELTRKIRARLAHVGLHVTSIRFEHPYALAPVVTVESHHPQRAANAFNGAVLATGLDMAGLFVRMVDAHGSVFLVSAGCGDHGEGWARRDIELHNVP